MAPAEPVWTAQFGGQAWFLSCPVYECLFEGTRGSAKTDALIMDFAQHVGRGHGDAWRGILFREEFTQLTDVIAKTKKWFFRIWGDHVGYNESSHTWKWATGEELLLRHMRRPDDYWKYHGHEYPWVGWEELTNWASPECFQLMKACCRSSDPDVPRKYRATANPYGRGHNWVKARFIDIGIPGVIHSETVKLPDGTEQNTERTRVHGHWSENRALLDADPEYPARLASDSNVQRRKAWLEGDWDIVAGGMFDDLWDRSVHIIEPFPIPKSWEIQRAFDWGSAHPFSVGWWAVSDGTKAPNGITYPRDSIFRISEWYGWNGQPNEGCRMTATKIAEGVLKREQNMNGVKAGPADSAIYNVTPGHKSIGQEMKEVGVTWIEADKKPGSRKSGWEVMRNMLEAATETPLEKPGLWVFNNCTHFIRTVPVLSRKENDPDDVDTDTEDHVADEARYMVLRRNIRATVGRVRI